eukprot:768244-Pyramimonas_sp.AAC.1
MVQHVGCVCTTARRPTSTEAKAAAARGGKKEELRENLHLNLRNWCHVCVRTCAHGHTAA